MTLRIYALYNMCVIIWWKSKKKVSDTMSVPWFFKFNFVILSMKLKSLVSSASACLFVGTKSHVHVLS